MTHACVISRRIRGIPRGAPWSSPCSFQPYVSFATSRPQSGYDKSSLQWRHNGRDGVSNHQPHYCLLNRLFRHRSKKIWKLRVTGLCAGNSPVTGELPAQKASNAENASIWWRHHGKAEWQWKVPFLCQSWKRIAEWQLILRRTSQLNANNWVLLNSKTNITCFYNQMQPWNTLGKLRSNGFLSPSNCYIAVSMRVFVPRSRALPFSLTYCGLMTLYGDTNICHCWFTAPSHYLYQCWLNTAGVLWHSPESNFTFHELHPKDVFDDNTFKIITPSPRAQWVYMIPKDNRCCVCHVELSDQMVTFLELHIIFAQLVHVLSHFVWRNTSSFVVSSFNPLQNI